MRQRKKTQSMAIPLRPAPRQQSRDGARQPSAVPKGSTRQHAPKPELDRAALKRLFSLMLPFMIFVALGLLLIWERVKVNQLAAAIAAMELQRNQAIEQNNKLRIEVEQLSGYTRISRMAAQLGMVTLPQQIIVVETE